MEKEQNIDLNEALENIENKKFRIRKLTERTCFRLMGVDDKDIDKIQEAGISRSAQYQLAGNSIVVDVMVNIFDQLFYPMQESDTLF